MRRAMLARESPTAGGAQFGPVTNGAMIIDKPASEFLCLIDERGVPRESSSPEMRRRNAPRRVWGVG